MMCYQLDCELAMLLSSAGSINNVNIISYILQMHYI